MLLTSLALVLSLQSSGETLTAVTNDDPETWVVEYPRVRVSPLLCSESTKAREVKSIQKVLSLIR
ncbi:MAG: hypothetical protein AAFN04_15290, partial [Pseudomonadota bacterium]